MPSTEERRTKDKKRLPARVWWLIGYAAVLALAAALVYYWRAVFLLDGLPAGLFTLGVAGLFSLIYLAVFLVWRLREKGTTARAALLLFLCGLLFCFATAPLQVPDEQNHFLRAMSVSMGRFTYEYEETYPNDADLLVQHFPHQMNHKLWYENGEFATNSMEQYKTDIAEDAQAEAKAGAPIMFLLLPYLPQGLFMAVARLFGFSALGMMYAGRMANLMVYCLLCWLAFKNCERFRGVFYAVAFLPLSLFLAASCSYDGLALGLCYLAVSVLFREKVETRHLVAFCLAVAVAVYIKPNNVLLLALLPLVPKARWRLRYSRWVVLGAGMAAAAVLYFGLGMGLDGGVLKQGWPDAVLDDARGGGGAAAPADQVMYMLRYPFKFLSVALLSVLEGNGFLFDMGRLGGMDLVLPVVGGLSALLPVVAAFLSARRRDKGDGRLALGLVVVAVVYAAAVLAGMYVADTDYQAVRISGLQARYFLPAFLMLFVAAGMLFARVVRPALPGPDGAVKAEKACLAMGVGLAVFAALLLFQSYYIGQWIPRLEGGWRLVNLLGTG